MAHDSTRSGPAAVLVFADLPAERRRRITAAAANLVRSAFLTLAAWPDQERRYLDRQLASPLGRRLVRDKQHDYPGESARSFRHRPDAREIGRCLEVLGWVDWLRRQHRFDGARGAKLLEAWAHGCPTFRLAQRYGRSDRTIERWRDAALFVIVERYWPDIERLADADPSVMPARERN